MPAMAARVCSLDASQLTLVLEGAGRELVMKPSWQDVDGTVLRFPYEGYKPSRCGWLKVTGHRGL